LSSAQELISRSLGLAKTKISLTLGSYLVQSVHLLSEKIINKQQEVADKCCSLGLIPKKVNVRDGFLSQ